MIRLIGPLCASFLAASAPAAQPSAVGESAAPGAAEAGLELYGKLVERDKNLLVSPLSVSGAFSMAAAGAKGTTAEELIKVFRFPGEGAAALKAFGELSSGLEERASRDGLTFRSAYGLAVKADAAVLPSYKDLVRADLGAEVFQVRDAAPVNVWAEKKTEGRVKGLLKSLSQSAVCVLLDAVYFKGDWERAFDSQETEQSPFTTARGKQVRARMMRRTGAFRLLRSEKDGVAILDLPYRGGEFSMVVLLPEELQGLRALESSLSSRRLGDWLRQLDERQLSRVSVSLPRFKLSRGLDLIPPLRAMGLSRPFAPGAADFGGIGAGLVISGAVHKAFLETDEKGTEAAAATAVVLSKGGSAEPPFRFTADHPFFFLIREKSSGTLLFMGRVADPSKD